MSNDGGPVEPIECGPIEFLGYEPANWWQAFKSRWFPTWLKCLSPPRRLEKWGWTIPHGGVTIPPGESRTLILPLPQRQKVLEDVE